MTISPDQRQYLNGSHPDRQSGFDDLGGYVDDAISRYGFHAHAEAGSEGPRRRIPETEIPMARSVLQGLIPEGEGDDGYYEAYIDPVSRRRISGWDVAELEETVAADSEYYEGLHDKERQAFVVFADNKAAGNRAANQIAGYDQSVDRVKDLIGELQTTDDLAEGDRAFLAAVRSRVQSYDDGGRGGLRIVHHNYRNPLTGEVRALSSADIAAIDAFLPKPESRPIATMPQDEGGDYSATRRGSRAGDRPGRAQRIKDKTGPLPVITAEDDAHPGLQAGGQGSNLKAAKVSGSEGDAMDEKNPGRQRNVIDTTEAQRDPDTVAIDRGQVAPESVAPDWRPTPFKRPSADTAPLVSGDGAGEGDSAPAKSRPAGKRQRQANREAAAAADEAAKEADADVAEDLSRRQRLLRAAQSVGRAISSKTVDLSRAAYANASTHMVVPMRKYYSPDASDPDRDAKSHRRRLLTAGAALGAAAVGVYLANRYGFSSGGSAANVQPLPGTGGAGQAVTPDTVPAPGGAGRHTENLHSPSVWKQIQSEYHTDNHDTADILRRTRELNPQLNLDHMHSGQSFVMADQLPADAPNLPKPTADQLANFQTLKTGGTDTASEAVQAILRANHANVTPGQFRSLVSHSLQYDAGIHRALGEPAASPTQMPNGYHFYTLSFEDMMHYLQQLEATKDSVH